MQSYRLVPVGDKIVLIIEPELQQVPAMEERGTAICWTPAQSVMILVAQQRAGMRAIMKFQAGVEDIPMNEAIAWESVLQRDISADERLFYGVRTTGIYCRPSCPSRKPKRDNVAFFSSVEAA